MKDIFVDNAVAVHNFSKPTKEYLEFITWLYENGEKNKSAYLVVSPKLIKEYYDSANACTSYTSIIVIYTTMLAQGRVIKFSNADIKAFQQRSFTKKINQTLRCNRKDRDHIPIILLSQRKMAVTEDKNFAHDLTNFPGFKTSVGYKPSDLNYK